MKQSVQIQTINSCNANCIKCPNTHIYQTRKVMEDEVFLKILYELKVTFPGVFMHFDVFLQNEPLLDPKLFDRIKLIKEFFKDEVEVFMSTNTMLVPKYKKQILEAFDPEVDEIAVSLHTWNAESYNLTHGTKISQDRFDKMKEASEEIKEVFGEKGHLNYFGKQIEENKELYSKPKDWYQLAYSRGGFLSKDRILLKEVHGCIRYKHKFLNFLHDGSLILCCMDYRRQTIMGNIKHQTLKQILNSDLYKNMIAKVEGAPSAKDFICKKCELGGGIAADTFKQFGLDGEDLLPLLGKELN